jgi:hypothetical protein
LPSLENRLRNLEEIHHRHFVAQEPAGRDNSWWTPELADEVTQILDELGYLEAVLAAQESNHAEP